MNADLLYFASEIIDCSVLIKKSADELLSDWYPDFPPATIYFATLGKAVRKDFDRIDKEARGVIFNLIEMMARDSNESVSNAGLCGFVEALVSVEDFSQELHLKIIAELGPLSKVHANLWVNFEGVNLVDEAAVHLSGSSDMSLDALKAGLDFLIKKYISSDELRAKLLAEVNQADPNNIGVKGILSEISSGGIFFDVRDSKLMSEIVFNYS